jgi:dolichol-phosphate mannosyltransferase
MPDRKDVCEISLITPMYNEAVRIERNVQMILQALEELRVTWEYILVDDGSTDDSCAKAEQILKGRSNCRIIHYEVNRGRGYALRRGFASAKGRYVITTESDLSWGADIIGRLYTALAETGADVVSASTYLPGGGMENVPFLRRALSVWGNRFMRRCFGNRLTMLSGMTRGYQRHVVRCLHLESTGKEIHLEIIAKAQALGSRIAEIPAVIRWEPGRSGQRGARRSVARFIVPHILSAIIRGASRAFLTLSLTLFALGALLAGFGVVNKIFVLTPDSLRMPNIITYGLVLIVIGALCALFAALSLQVSALHQGIVHIQAQLKSLQEQSAAVRGDEDEQEPA